MRKVLFKKWNKEVYSENMVMISAKHEDVDYIHEGVFHQWASAYEESSEGFGNYTVAIVELPDGTITEVLPSRIKFI